MAEYTDEEKEFIQYMMAYTDEDFVEYMKAYFETDDADDDE